MPANENARQLKLEKMEAYFNWMMTPPVERVPPSKQAFAELLGVAVSTLYNYERDPIFHEKIATAKNRLGAAWYGDILGRLKSIVDGGSNTERVAAARLLLKHLAMPEEEKKGLQGVNINSLEKALEILKAAE